MGDHKILEKPGSGFMIKMASLQKEKIQLVSKLLGMSATKATLAGVLHSASTTSNNITVIPALYIVCQ